MGNPVKGNEIVDPKALDTINAELKEMLQTATDLQVVFKSILQTSAGIAKTTPLKGYKDIEKVNEALRSGKKAVIGINETEKQRLQLLKKLTIANSDRIQRNVELQLQLKKQKKINIDLAKDALGLTSLYDKQSKKLNTLRKRYKNVALAEGENSRSAKILLKSITKLDSKLKKIDANVGQFQRNVGNYAKGLRSLGNILGAAGLTLGAAGFFRVLKSGIGILKEYDEAITDLQKTTDTTKKEALELGEAIRQIDTRTSVNSLLALASAAGRLGLRGQDVVDFTEQTDKAFVALGDVLEGSASDIGLTLGKIADQFGVERVFGIGEAINKIGSSLNELGANSKATEDKIIDFTKRIAGVATQANISAPDVQALGALFDEAGQSVEVSASTINKLLPVIGKNIEKFAKIAGKDIEEFSDIARKDAFQALLLVAEGAKSSEDGLIGLTDTLENYGISSARSASIVGVLSNSTERLNELRTISNDAFEKGTSLTDEFTKKNETLAASFEKFTKKIQDYVLGLNESTDVSRKLTSTVKFLTKNLGAILKVTGALITAFVTYKAITIAATVVTKTYALVQKTASFAQKAYTASTKAATTATNFFSKAVKNNPLGLFVSLITTAIALLWDYSDAAGEAADSQKELNETQKEFNALKSGTEDIVKRFNIIKSLSKRQVDDLKSDIDAQVKLEEDFTKKLLKEAKDRVAGDLRIIKLKEEIAEAEKTVADETLKSAIIAGKLGQINTISVRINQDLIDKDKARREGLNELRELSIKVALFQKESNKAKVEEVFLLKELEKQLKLNNEERAKIVGFGEDTGRFKQLKLEAEELTKSIALLREKLKLEDNEIKKLKSKTGSIEDFIKSIGKLSDREKEIDDEITAKRKKIADEQLARIAKEKKAKEDARAEEFKQKQRITEYIENVDSKLHERKIERIDREIEASERQQDKLALAAAQGQADAVASLAFEEKKVAELEQKKIKAAKRQIFEEKALAFYKLMTAKAEQGDKNPAISAGKEIFIGEALLAGIQGFIEGTGDAANVAEAMGNKGKVTNGKDGYTARFDGREKIIKPEHADILNKAGFKSNDDLVNLAVSKSNGDFDKAIQMNAIYTDNTEIISELKNVRSAINNIKASNTDFYYNSITDSFVKRISSQNKVEKFHQRNTGGIFS